MFHRKNLYSMRWWWSNYILSSKIMKHIYYINKSDNIKFSKCRFPLYLYTPHYFSNVFFLSKWTVEKSDALNYVYVNVASSFYFCHFHLLIKTNYDVKALAQNFDFKTTLRKRLCTPNLFGTNSVPVTLLETLGTKLKI